MASGDWTEDHVRRLFWRAGFGATPEEATNWAAAGPAATLKWVLDGDGGAELGQAPTADGKPLDPVNVYGHDVLWWLDRMVRSRRPLVEKLTLFWHDHFATAGQDTPLMLRQNRTLRANALGSFRALLGQVTRDPAMQLFLSLSDNDKNAPNENYARELMELFTLGAGYTEHDIREAARALTGWRPIKDGAGNVHSVVFARSHHDNGVKQIFGHRGRIGTSRVLDLVTTHRKHAPFITRKLWDFFVTRPPDGATATALVNTYRSGNGEIKPVVAQILTHPFLYADLDAPDMVKCPVVYVAGHLRTTGSPVTSGAYTWLLNAMGQLPFRPPSVAGWDWGTPWLSTGAVRARFALGNHLLGSATAPLPVPAGTGDPALSPEAQLEAALAATGRPWISPATRATLTAMAAGFFSDLKPRQRPQRAKRADMLQRVLRHLLLTGPDAQLH